MSSTTAPATGQLASTFSMGLRNAATVGDAAWQRVNQIVRVLEETQYAPYLQGPPGSGKTHTALEAANIVAKRRGVNVVYIQLHDELSRSKLEGGYTIENGSSVLKIGPLGQAMLDGDLVVIDETTQTRTDILISLNSTLSERAINIGDMIIRAADTFGVIFCANGSSVAGNIRLPQAFANRLYPIEFGYLDAITEAEIGLSLAERMYTGEITAPPSVALYLSQVIAKLRQDKSPYPLSSRNIAQSLVRLSFLEALPEPDKQADNEAVRRGVAERLGIRITSSSEVDDLDNEDINSLMSFVSSVGVQRFRSEVLAAFGHFLDIEGTEMSATRQKAQMEALLFS